MRKPVSSVPMKYCSMWKIVGHTHNKCRQRQFQANSRQGQHPENSRPPSTFQLNSNRFNNIMSNNGPVFRSPGTTGN